MSVNNDDFNIIKVLMFLVATSFSYLSLVKPNNVLLVTLLWGFIALSVLIIFGWGLLQLLINDSPYFFSVRWLVTILIIILPLIISILITYEIYLVNEKYVFISNIIQTIYALFFTLYFMLTLLYEKIITYEQPKQQ